MDTYVEDEEVTFARWEKLAMDRRNKGARDRANDPGLVTFPCFAHSEVRVGGKTGVEQQMEIDAYLKTTRAPEAGRSPAHG